MSMEINWVLDKGVEGESSVSLTSQGRRSNQWRKTLYVVETSGGGVDPIVLKTLASKTISVSLEDKFGSKQVNLGTFLPIKDKCYWQGKKTLIHWGLFPVGVKFEPWVIAPGVLSESGYVRRHLLNKERFILWD